jgi:hypothetical protein
MKTISGAINFGTARPTRYDRLAMPTKHSGIRSNGSLLRVSELLSRCSSQSATCDMPSVRGAPPMACKKLVDPSGKQRGGGPHHQLIGRERRFPYLPRLRHRDVRRSATVHVHPVACRASFRFGAPPSIWIRSERANCRPRDSYRNITLPTTKTKRWAAGNMLAAARRRADL